jgi:hypothetical protein
MPFSQCVVTSFFNYESPSSVVPLQLLDAPCASTDDGRDLRRNWIYVLLRIADLSEQLPPSIKIHGVTIAERETPQFSGGLADIFLGEYMTQPVAIKRVRIVRNVDRADVQRVRTLSRRANCAVT